MPLQQQEVRVKHLKKMPPKLVPARVKQPFRANLLRLCVYERQVQAKILQVLLKESPTMGTGLCRPAYKANCATPHTSLCKSAGLRQTFLPK